MSKISLRNSFVTLSVKVRISLKNLYYQENQYVHNTCIMIDLISLGVALKFFTFPYNYRIESIDFIRYYGWTFNNKIRIEKTTEKIFIYIVKHRAHISRVDANIRKEWLQLHRRNRTGKCRYANEPLMVNKWTSKLACIAPARGTWRQPYVTVD